METVRIDKWLWAVRIFKTRSQATNACKAGKVKMDDHSVKPSKEVKIEDVVTVQLGPLKKVLKVTGLIERRVSAKLAVQNVEDLTPEEEIGKLKKMKEVNYEHREKGLGRPTKKQRRLIDHLKKQRHF
ncbi:MAG: RNA-binding S4 domain-containing protein [Bacteroidales bacterium]